MRGNMCDLDEGFGGVKRTWVNLEEKEEEEGMTCMFIGSGTREWGEEGGFMIKSIGPRLSHALSS